MVHSLDFYRISIRQHRYLHQGFLARSYIRRREIALLQYLDLCAAHRWHLQQTIREAAILQIHEVILIR